VEIEGHEIKKSLRNQWLGIHLGCRDPPSLGFSRNTFSILTAEEEIFISSNISRSYGWVGRWENRTFVEANKRLLRISGGIVKLWWNSGEGIKITLR